MRPPRGSDRLRTLTRAQVRSGESRRWASLAPLVLATLVLGRPAPVDGDLRVVQLSDEALPSSDVSAISPDGARVTLDGGRIVYVQDARFEDVFELFSVRRDGTDRVRLSPDLAAGTGIGQFAITPDGTRVVFTMGPTSPNRFGLYVVPIGGPASAFTAVFVDADPSASVQAPFAITADSSAVVLRSRGQGVVAPSRVVRASLVGDRKAVELFPGSVVTDPAWAFWVSPNERNVVIAAGGLYAVPLWGSADEVIRLDEGEATGPGQIVYPNAFTPDSRRFVFGKSDEPSGVHAKALYSVPVVGPGSAAVRLSPQEAFEVTWAEVSGDSTTVCMRSIPAPGGQGVIFTVPIGGPADAAVRVSLPLFRSWGAGICQFTGDSSAVVYSDWMDYSGDVAALAVPTEGPPEFAVRLTLPVDPTTGTLAWRLDSRGSTLLYSGQYGGDGSSRLHAVPVAGPAAASVPMGLPFYDPTGEWAGTLNAPDMRSVLLFADFGNTGQFEMLRLDLEHPEDPGVFLNAPLVPGGSVVFDFAWLPDSLGVVYRADAEIDEKFELYIADALVFADGFESGDTNRWSKLQES